ncbi:MAG: hypothetical protein M3O70_16070, partial [Actinomycetota bacterium]|nr:hypothetical protein [Actinomycetota bacterium]
MRKILTAGALGAVLVLSQAAPALAHSTDAEVSSDGVRVNYSTVDHDNEDGVLDIFDYDDENDGNSVLEDILGVGNDEDDGDSLLEDILGSNDDENVDENDGVLGIFDYDNE